MTRTDQARRRFIAGGMAITGSALARDALAKDDDEVSPTEDLMREHGVLRRLLLVYGEVARRLDGKEDVKAEWISRSATIIRDFIEDYHEKDEEELVFPRLLKAGKLSGLVTTLLAQHEAGRRITLELLRTATSTALAADSSRERLRAFARMYEPHAAREDTVLFPAFRALLNERELKRLTDLFEDKEKALPHGGFEKMVAEVARIETSIGIDDLALFTPA